jgi:hypothetical protein
MKCGLVNLNDQFKVNNMKKYHYNYILFLVAAMGVAISGCEKNGLRSVDMMKSENDVYTKVYFYPPEIRQLPPPLQPGSMMKIGETKMGASFFYSLVTPANAGVFQILPAGNQEVRFTIPEAGTTKDSITFFTTHLNFEKGKYYSLFVCDTNSTMKMIQVEDDYTAPKEGFGKLRFAHIMMGLGPIDIKLDNGTVIYENVDYQTILPFVEFDMNTVYNFRVYKAGTNTLMYSHTNVPIQNGRFYTVLLRGWVGKATADGGPILTRINNK